MTLPEPLPAGLPDEDFSDLTPAGVSSLLHLVLPATRSPVDELVAHLSAPESEAWFLDAIPKGLGMDLAAAESMILGGVVDEETLRDITKRAKKTGAPSHGAEVRLCATLSYLLAHAAALVHLNKFLSSCKKSNFEPVFERLAATTPRPWSELFARARKALDAMPER